MESESPNAFGVAAWLEPLVFDKAFKGRAAIIPVLIGSAGQLPLLPSPPLYTLLRTLIMHIPITWRRYAVVSQGDPQTGIFFIGVVIVFAGIIPMAISHIVWQRFVQAHAAQSAAGPAQERPEAAEHLLADRRVSAGVRIDGQVKQATTSSSTHPGTRGKKACFIALRPSCAGSICGTWTRSPSGASRSCWPRGSG